MYSYREYAEKIGVNTRLIISNGLLATLIVATLDIIIAMTWQYHPPLLRGEGPLVSFIMIYLSLIAGLLIGLLIYDLLIYRYFDPIFKRRGLFIGSFGGVNAYVFNGRYNGFGFSSLLRGIAFVFTPNGTLDDTGRAILAHEIEHARDRHGLVIISTALLFPAAIVTSTYLNNPTSYAFLLFAPFLIMLTFLTWRLCEIHADLAMHRAFGARSLDYLRNAIKAMYGVDDFKRVPLRSRITHPGRRDLVLAFGDAVAPHAPWEIPLMASLFVGGVVGTSLIHWLTPIGFNTRVLILYYSLVVINALILIFSLGLVYRPIVRLFLDNLLTERGLLNTSLLLSSIYVASSSISVLTSITPFPNTLLLIPLLIALAAVYHYSRNFRASLMAVAATMAVFVAVGYLLTLLIPMIAPRLMPMLRT
ncbi:hypothetical protein [Vulcanisaeta thermophila]|uniref:hypothetical protein n=1 Tax=Vulcanisaeta thermophila TaxID=867917 RepID=UPI001180AC38|nr:hypothetical protein [Vulcanisaeta thermophila]